MRASQPPFGDGRGHERPPDAATAIGLAHHEVADPSFERGVIQPAPEAEDDEAGRRALGRGQERGRIGVIDEGLVRRPMGLPIGIGQPVQLANQRERLGEVVSRQRPDLDAVGPRHGEAADRPVGIAQVH